MPRRPETSVGTPTTAAASASTQLADLPLVGREAHQQRAQPEEPDAGQSGTEPHADPAALFRRERRLAGRRSSQAERRRRHAVHSSSLVFAATDRVPTCPAARRVERDAEPVVFAADAAAAPIGPTRRRRSPSRPRRGRDAREPPPGSRDTRDRAPERPRPRRARARDRTSAAPRAVWSAASAVGLRLRNGRSPRTPAPPSFCVSAPMKALCTASKSRASAAGGARRVSSSDESSRPECAASRPACARRVAVAIRVLAAVGEHAVDAHLAERTNHRGGHLDAQDVLGRRTVERPFGRIAHAVAGHHVQRARCSGRR